MRPAAFVVLKALAFRNRGENKDAADLYYMIRNFGRGVEEVASRLRPLLNDPSAKLAITILGEDFLEHDGLGARRVAVFLNDGAPDDDLQADVTGFVGRLLQLLHA